MSYTELNQMRKDAAILTMERDGWEYNEGIVEVGSGKIGFQKGNPERPEALRFFNSWDDVYDYIRENRGRLTVPIAETKGFVGRGVLAGSELGRGKAYEAVRAFEAVNFVGYPVISKGGNYEDKDFLYAAYDEYVAMSHHEELLPYRQRFDAAVAAEIRRREQYGFPFNVEQIYNERLCEVYYAKTFGLTEQQIDVMIGDGSRNPYMMRQLRKMYVAGLSQEQVDALTVIENESAIEYAAEYLYNGGSIDVVRQIPPYTDMATMHYALDALSRGEITEKSAVAIFKAGDKIQQFSKDEFERVERETPGRGRYPFGGIDFDFFAEYLVSLASTKARILDGESLVATVEDWLSKGAQGALSKHPLVFSYDNGRMKLTGEQLVGRKFDYSGNVWEVIEYKDGVLTLSDANSGTQTIQRRASEFLNVAGVRDVTDDMIAIESTNDYADTAFHAVLKDADVQNEDGSYGKLAERYRIVTIGESNRVEPMNDVVYETEEAAKAAAAVFTGYRLVSYDDIIHAAQERMMGVNQTKEEKVLSQQNAEVPHRASVERLYAVNGRFLHIQKSEDGWDYTLYDANMKDLDGGRLDRPELDISAAYGEVCAMHQLDPAAGSAVSLSVLEEKLYVKDLWDKVNGAKTRSEIAEVEKLLNDAKIDGETYNEMMKALSYISRESYREEKSAAAPFDAENEKLSPKEQLQKQLEAGVRSVMDTEAFKHWLGTSSRMFTRQYSFQNAMLIWLQKPNASYTMGYEAWKHYGRNVQQGAQGAKIFVPLLASEKVKGGLFSQIKRGLNEQLAAHPDDAVVSYRLGNSKLEFTLNRSNRMYGVRMDGKDRGQLGGEAETKRFIERSVLGKIPYGFTVGTVFDIRDVAEPEFLWVKKDYTKEEVVKDEKGRPIKNRRGEVKIINTPERKARFQPNLDTHIEAQNPVKMRWLLDACTEASERKGVPVFMRSKDEDENLDGGAKGYFSREFTPELPKGFIVIDKDLEVTEQVAVLMHEMAHADLHGNLEKLNAQMGERATRNMREVQAEASAYAVASQFGINTDTSSFAYLAAWSTGYQLQEFQKSLELIYKEAKELTADIRAELDFRNLDMNLNRIETDKFAAETVKILSARYIDFATQQERTIMEINSEMPEMMEQAKEYPELSDILRYQRENIDARKSDVEVMIVAVDALNKAQNRNDQLEQIAILEATQSRIQQSTVQFEILSESFVATNEQLLTGGWREAFERNPMDTLKQLGEEYPRMKEMSIPQKEYISTSKYISSQLVKLLRSNPEEFVNKACDRAETASKMAAKNGTFVEVNFCEQWTDKPVFETGTICHPKIAERTAVAAEKQIQKMRKDAESRGEYFPYTKCDMTVYANTEKGLKGWAFRVDIGDGGQQGISDFLQQMAGKQKLKNEILQKFGESIAERAPYKVKIANPAKNAPAEKELPAEQVKKRSILAQSAAVWKAQIAAVKAQRKESVKTPAKTENKERGQGE